MKKSILYIVAIVACLLLLPGFLHSSAKKYVHHSVNIQNHSASSHSFTLRFYDGSNNLLETDYANVSAGGSATVNTSFATGGKSTHVVISDGFIYLMDMYTPDFTCSAGCSISSSTGTFYFCSGKYQYILKVADSGGCM